MVRSVRRYHIIFFFTTSLLMSVRGLSNLQVDIPTTAIHGSSVTLTCSFSLEFDELYSVKWYRGKLEIFRFMPLETPPTRVFYQKWFHVSSLVYISSTSTTNFLRLWNISFINSGDYSCEVTAEASFETLIKTKTLTVIMVWEPPVETTNESSTINFCYILILLMYFFASFA